ncbi:hypothetical protein CYMTET_49478 [Cymbomonas tetramitiformis]|uniref:Uncharacterized protein n=1 Tax=Cymbomonas tetramitiformis TaxID=36881 RepID=A0AAE0ETV0_9CHLO|nr:hypothetical protein CYMTET_49478 [Cymbomonas tetramitiformis]
MGKKSQRQRSGRKTKTQVQGPHNFVPETGIGCYIVHFDAPWLLVLGVEPFDTDDYEDDVTFPDIAISAEAPHTLSIINASDHTRTFYVTMFHDVFDGQERRGCWLIAMRVGNASDVGPSFFLLGLPS